MHSLLRLAALSMGIGFLANPTLLAQQAGSQQKQVTPPPFPADLVRFTGSIKEPVFSGRGEGKWDAKIRERGWILKECKKYRMWYTGYNGTREGIKRLGYATSSDGIQWQRRDEPLVANTWVEDMMVLKHNGRYLMFAEGRGDQSQLLTSRDGLKWQRVGRLDVRLKNGDPIPSGPFGTPTAFVRDGVFHLFYERFDSGIWLAASRDLRVWTNVSDEPVLKPGPAQYDRLMIAMNQIVQRGEWYYAMYHGTGSPTKPRDWCVGIAASRDLVNWVKYDRNPLLPVAENKSSGIVVGEGAGLRFFTMHDKVHIHAPVATKNQKP